MRRAWRDVQRFAVKRLCSGGLFHGRACVTADPASIFYVRLMKY